MNMTEIRNRGRDWNIAGMGKMRKAELIQAIQGAEGNQPCYGAEWRFDCPQLDCCWRKDCLGRS